MGDAKRRGSFEKRRRLAILKEKEVSMFCKCGSCRFWFVVDSKNEAGDCRRYPPTPFLITGVNPITNEQKMGVTTYFPQTRQDIWCGEGKEREN